jgi:hypothetical protein
MRALQGLITSFIIITGVPSIVGGELNATFYTVKCLNVQKDIYTEHASWYTLSSTDRNFSLPETPFQRVLRVVTADEKVVITIVSGEGNHRDQSVSPSSLQNTRFLNTDNREIQRLSERFRHSSTPLADIERFVFNHIVHKKIGIPIIPARDILRMRSGDCTEHSILTIALLRAQGIPARAAVGMILTESFAGMEDVFVFHMWVEAFANGRWVLIDSTRPARKKANRYITFSYHHLKTEMPLSYLSAIAAIKNLTVTYLKGERRPPEK